MVCFVNLEGMRYNGGKKNQKKKKTPKISSKPNLVTRSFFYLFIFIRIRNKKR